MTSTKLALALGILAIVTSACGGVSPEDAADVVYTNGRIYTVNDAQPWAEAVAIKDGRFLVVGGNVDVEAVTGNGTEEIPSRTDRRQRYTAHVGPTHCVFNISTQHSSAADGEALDGEQSPQFRF